MIKIDRNRIPTPEILDASSSDRARQEFEKARKFYAIPEKERRQRRFAFKLYGDRSVKEALDELFYRKCAFCESKYAATAPLDVAHFRPKGGVIDSDRHYPDHYWWLANDWHNLYPSCINCNRMSAQLIGGERRRSGKGGRFPILGPRANLEAEWTELAAEQPLLLDPCSDEPEDHLVFTPDGLVVSETDHGQTTIEVFGLNREQLVKGRRLAADRATSVLKDLIGTEDAGAAAGVFRRIIHPSQEYAGLRRQIAKSYASRIPGVGKIEPELGGKVVSRREAIRVKKEYQAYQRSQEDFSLSEPNAEKYFSRRRLIEGIEIRNLKRLGT